MNYFGSIEVCDRVGWKKIHPLTKALTTIGSAQFNDIVLSTDHGNSVAPIHLQVIGSDHPEKSIQVINLVNAAIPRISGETSEHSLITPNHPVFLLDGDQLEIGDFQIKFSLNNFGVTYAKRSEHIGVDFEISNLNLQCDKALIGILTLTNLGEQNHCQFEVDLDGLPPECYQIDPAPVLYPGARENLTLRFFHKVTQPSAGICPITIRVTSPESYPTEEVLLKIELDVETVFEYQVDEYPVDNPVLILSKKSAFAKTIFTRFSPILVPPPLPASLDEGSPVEANIDEPIPTTEVQAVNSSDSNHSINHPDSLKTGNTKGQSTNEMNSETPAESGWNNALNNRPSVKKQRLTPNLQNARVLKAVIEPAEQKNEDAEGSEAAASLGELHD